MYLVRAMTRHNCTLDIGILCRCGAVARLHLLTSFVPTPRLKLVVSVTANEYTLVTFRTERVCTFL
jgi:hypothetical protein